MLWTKSWVKFKGGGVQDRKVYPQIRRERAPERVDLDELDKTHWEMGLDGRPKDPWVFQYLLPLENKNGDRVIFVTSSFGGRRAVSDVCAAWGRKAAKDASAGLPIVQLTEAMMPTKKFGDVPRPHFQIIRWENSSRLEPVREIDPNALSGGEMEMNDEIPF
jgi:hypothetical protein